MDQKGVSPFLWVITNRVITLQWFEVFFMSKGRQFQDFFTGRFRMTTPTWTIELQSQTASLYSLEHFTGPN